MNTEQTEKSLGQIAMNSMYPGSDWESCSSYVQEGYNYVAQAIATEVLNRLPGEWILLHEEEIIEIGDEKYSVGMWAPVSVNVLGKMVGGRIVRRRLSPVPSQQPQLGSPEGVRPTVGASPSQGADVPPAVWSYSPFRASLMKHGEVFALVTPDGRSALDCAKRDELLSALNATTPPPAPRAEWKPRFKVGDRVRVEGFQTTFTVEYLPHDSKDAYRMVGGYNAKEDELTAAPWKLPEPPMGMQWHRMDWTQDMLPEGYRPLLLGEYGTINIDEFASYPNGVWLSVQATGPSVPGQLHTRTRRPLPAPSTPQPEEIPYEETDLFHARKALLDEGMRANTLMQERDAALASASEAEKRVDRHIEVGNAIMLAVTGVVSPLSDSEIEGRFKQLTSERDSFSSLADELKVKLAAAEQKAVEAERVGQADFEIYHQVRLQLVNAGCDEFKLVNEMVDELIAQRDQARASVSVWVPLSERAPVEKVGPEVLYYSWGHRAWIGYVNHPADHGVRATHWQKLSPLPPLPVETEEGERKRFEEWALSGHANEFDLRRNSKGEYALSDSSTAWFAWQAALRSKKPS
jgi:hypothetical protein